LTDNEGNVDVEEGTELSEVSSLKAPESISEHEIQPLPEETNLTSETPTGVEEDRILQNQEKAAAEARTKLRAKQTKEIYFSKLSDQLTRHLQLSKESGDKTRNILGQIQRQLKQIDKIAASCTKQQIVVKQIAVQLKVVQKQVDKMNKTISRLGIISNTKKISGVRGKSKKTRTKK
jgi:hypothetical protein